MHYLPYFYYAVAFNLIDFSPIKGDAFFGSVFYIKFTWSRMSENINLEKLVEVFRKLNSTVDELGFNSYSKSFIQPSKYELFCSFIQETFNKLNGRKSLRSFLSHFRHRLLDEIVHKLHGLSFYVFKGLWTFERFLFRLRLFIYKFT